MKITEQQALQLVQLRFQPLKVDVADFTNRGQLDEDQKADAKYSIS